MKQKAAQMYENGDSAPTIADACGVSSTTVYRWLDDMGISRREQKDAQSVVEIENLEDMYEDMTCQEIADEVGCDAQTVHNRLTEQGIETRKAARRRKDAVPYRVQNGGYETWRYHEDGTEYAVLVHRLAAVAWFGYEAVCGMDVHHKSGHPRDNREDNFQIVTRSEHARIHSNKRWTNEQ